MDKDYQGITIVMWPSWAGCTHAGDAADPSIHTQIPGHVP